MDPVCSEGKRKSFLQEHNRSPWSSESTNSSTSPLPMASGLNRGNSNPNPAGSTTGRIPSERSFWSGGSTCSLGSSPGASFNTALTVPEYNACCQMLARSPEGRGCQGGGGSSKADRSPSPFNLKARVRRRRQKRMEKQSNLNANSYDDHSKNESPTNLNVAIYGGYSRDQTKN